MDNVCFRIDCGLAPMEAASFFACEMFVVYDGVCAKKI